MFLQLKCRKKFVNGADKQKDKPTAILQAQQNDRKYYIQGSMTLSQEPLGTKLLALRKKKSELHLQVADLNL